MNNRTIIISIVLAALSLSGCFNTMEVQDHRFVEKLKKAFETEGNIIKVSDVHDGEWAKVCHTTFGARSDAIQIASRFTGLEKEEIIVRNRKRADTKHSDDYGFGFYFFYAPNEIEFFEIYRNVMRPYGGEKDEYDCVSRDSAFLKLLSKPNKEKNQISYLIQLTSNSEELAE